MANRFENPQYSQVPYVSQDLKYPFQELMNFGDKIKAENDKGEALLLKAQDAYTVPHGILTEKPAAELNTIKDNYLKEAADEFHKTKNYTILQNRISSLGRDFTSGKYAPIVQTLTEDAENVKSEKKWQSDYTNKSDIQGRFYMDWNNNRIISGQDGYDKAPGTGTFSSLAELQNEIDAGRGPTNWYNKVKDADALTTLEPIFKTIHPKYGVLQQKEIGREVDANGNILIHYMNGNSESMSSQDVENELRKQINRNESQFKSTQPWVNYKEKLAAMQGETYTKEQMIKDAMSFWHGDYYKETDKYQSSKLGNSGGSGQRSSNTDFENPILEAEMKRQANGYTSTATEVAHALAGDTKTGDGKYKHSFVDGSGTILAPNIPASIPLNDGSTSISAKEYTELLPAIALYNTKYEDALTKYNDLVKKSTTPFQGQTFKNATFIDKKTLTDSTNKALTNLKSIQDQIVGLLQTAGKKIDPNNAQNDIQAIIKNIPENYIKPVITMDGLSGTYDVEVPSENNYVSIPDINGNKSGYVPQLITVHSDKDQSAYDRLDGLGIGDKTIESYQGSNTTPTKKIKLVAYTPSTASVSNKMNTHSTIAGESDKYREANGIVGVRANEYTNWESVKSYSTQNEVKADKQLKSGNNENVNWDNLSPEAFKTVGSIADWYYNEVKSGRINDKSFLANADNIYSISKMINEYLTRMDDVKGYRENAKDLNEITYLLHQQLNKK